MEGRDEGRNGDREQPRTCSGMVFDPSTGKVMSSEPSREYEHENEELLR
jgi:hypothetical protein